MCIEILLENKNADFIQSDIQKSSSKLHNECLQPWIWLQLEQVWTWF